MDRIGGNEGRSILMTSDQWPDIINAHLEGDRPIGVYPITPNDDHCRWGCVDFDHSKPASEYKTPQEAQQAAHLLQRVLQRVGITSWLEISRSRGAHLWTFATEPVPARTMRRALIVAHQIISMPYREINPKQEQLSGKIGSYVRLPYPAARTKGTQEVMWRGIPLTAQDFTERAAANRTTPPSYERVASMYREQPAVTVLPKPTMPVQDTNLPPLIRHIMHNGPLPDRDRSGTLFKLALRCRDNGLDTDAAYNVLLEADQRWGKFAKANNLQQLERIIQQVYR